MTGSLQRPRDPRPRRTARASCSRGCLKILRQAMRRAGLRGASRATSIPHKSPAAPRWRAAAVAQIRPPGAAKERCLSAASSRVPPDRSPGCIHRPDRSSSPTSHTDPWRGARALFAAGFRPGDVVLNTFSYHLTPGGFIFDSSARALGCAVIPAGPGNTEAQFELIEAYRPAGYSGTPDFLKILLDAAKRRTRYLLDQARAGVGRGVSEIAAGRDQVARHRGLSGLRHRRSRPDRLRDPRARRHGRQRRADPGNRAARHRRSGRRRRCRRDRRHVARSASPLDPARARRSHGCPARRSPCGRSNLRIKGWMGRADQTTKIKGMFVRPEQIAEIGKRHPASRACASSSRASARRTR